MNDHFLAVIESHIQCSTALIDDRWEIDYGELRYRYLQVAALFKQKYGEKNYLLISATSCIDFIITLFGIIASGNIPIPIDPELPDHGIDYIKKKSGAVELIKPIPIKAYKTIEPLGYTDIDTSMPAMILFTSGTSGFPKGVMISHRNILFSCREISNYLDYQKYPSAAVVLPLHYSYALLSQVFAMLYVAGVVRLFESFRNPIKFANTVDQLNLQTFCGVPSTYQSLILLNTITPICMDKVQVICSAGAAMDRTRYNDIKKIFPNAVFYNNYGMTEATPRISYIRDDDSRFLEATCGKPMNGVDVCVIDADTHAHLEESKLGILAIRGENITKGYINDPIATQKAFTRDGWLISGDMALIQDGYIYIYGRADDIFNVGGEKISPLEIEHVLNRHEAIETSGVVGVPDEQRGNIAVAFIKINNHLTRKQLIEFQKEWLPPSHIPQRYFEIRDMPMTTNGKIQRKKLTIEDQQRIIREIS